VPIPDARTVRQDVTVTARQEYLVVVPEADRAVVSAACAELVRMLSPELRRATVDAFSDYRDLEAPVARAFDELRGRAENPQKAMAVRLDLADPGQRETLRQVAAWTIHAEVFGPDGEVAMFHDCGSEITAHLTFDQAGALVQRLERFDGVEVLTLEEWRRHHPGRWRRMIAFLRPRR
jgi:hypothetical protein